MNFGIQERMDLSPISIPNIVCIFSLMPLVKGENNRKILKSIKESNTFFLGGCQIIQWITGRCKSPEEMVIKAYTACFGAHGERFS